MDESPRPLLPAVVIEPPVEARAAVVWLHGLGADGHDFEPVVPHLGLEPERGIRFVFPHAPAIPVTVNLGMVMPAWYDVRDLSLRGSHDARGFEAAVRRVGDLVRRERERGVPSRRIVVAGFSQGGAVGLHAALRHDEPLAGLLLLSTYLVEGDRLERERSAANRALGVFQAHGRRDPMVPLARGEEARDRLRAWGHEVRWEEYPVAHEVCLEEIRSAGAWLAARLDEGEGPAP